MAFRTPAGGVMSLLTEPEVPIFDYGGIISAEDFNAISDDKADTVLWGEGDKAVTKATGMAYLQEINKIFGQRTDTIMDEGTWMAEIFYKK